MMILNNIEQINVQSVDRKYVFATLKKALIKF